MFRTIFVGRRREFFAKESAQAGLCGRFWPIVGTKNDEFTEDAENLAVLKGRNMWDDEPDIFGAFDEHELEYAAEESFWLTYRKEVLRSLALTQTRSWWKTAERKGWMSNAATL